jgi:galactokinase
MDISTLKKDFLKLYGGEDKNIRAYFAPGRVNLIGEHVDYNGGYVFPCALSFGTYLLARKNSDNVVRFATGNFDYKITIPLKDLSKKLDGGKWANYPLGVIDQFAKIGNSLNTGLDILIYGNVPNGAGLSSSASIEVVTATMLNDMMGCNLNMIDLVKMSQKAENQFVGVNCGIMDQFASGMGKKDHAVFLNCDTLEYELVPIKLKGVKLVIANTNKRRGLADSKYNERRAECDKAVEYINKKKTIKLLGELSVAEFENIKSSISDPVVLKRALHVVTEIKRTLDAVTELKAGNIERFGKLMNGSHDSLRDDYEVTGIELDTLVEEARKIKGTLGSRMTGAGFGGCTVSLVKDDAIDEFKKVVGENYKKRTGLTADFYVAEVGDGAKRIE